MGAWPDIPLGSATDRPGPPKVLSLSLFLSVFLSLSLFISGLSLSVYASLLSVSVCLPPFVETIRGEAKASPFFSLVSRMTIILHS